MWNPASKWNKNRITLGSMAPAVLIVSKMRFASRPSAAEWKYLIMDRDVWSSGRSRNFDYYFRRLNRKWKTLSNSQTSLFSFRMTKQFSIVKFLIYYSRKNSIHPISLRKTSQFRLQPNGFWGNFFSIRHLHSVTFIIIGYYFIIERMLKSFLNPLNVALSLCKTFLITERPAHADYENNKKPTRNRVESFVFLISR